MVVDFSKIDVKEYPMLILRTNDGEPIGVLGYSFNIEVQMCYNETSELTFNIPAYVNKIKTPLYDDVIGMRIIDLKDIGQFILVNPKIQNDGIKEIKECTAYSLEYEFTYKKITLENSTYNFWNPLAQSGTILSIIMEKMPSWSIGTVDTDLVGKYRTFDVSNENLYNFIKSTIQETYMCVFEFDTYNRKVNVRSANSYVSTEPIYLSFDNLIKEMEITEDSENILTCLDVNGADGIDIRSVNPMGTNKIYDYNYFMNTTNFPQTFIDKYNSWKTTFENYQLPYYNLTIEQALKTTEILTEQTALVDLYGDLKNLENQQAVTIQSIAQNLKNQSDLNSINSQISAKSSQITTKKSAITTIEEQLDDITAQMIVINKATAFSTFFTSEEILLLDKYTKEDSLSDSSFVAPTVQSYNTADLSSTITSTTYNITDANITKFVNSITKDIYSISGGNVSVTSGVKINAEVIKASYEVGTDKKFLFTAYFKSGSIDDSSFESGCISLTGSVSSTTSDATPDATLPAISNGTRLTFIVSSAQFYFTQNTTMYEQRSIEWDLHDYGRECLGKLATPSYTFSVDSANFFSLDEFVSFKNKIMLGNKVYLRINDDGILQPIVVKCVINFEELNNFSFEFSSTYKASDIEFKITDLLEQSISMGNKLDLSQFSYNKWIDSGAETQVSKFMTSALDVGVNAILSSSGQAPTLDDAGLRLRKLLDNGEYSPKQIWMNNNSIMLTSNNWSTAEIGIGEFVDTNCGSVWGVVAPMIVGTILAGSNLVIESAKKDGGISVFRVDGDGAALYNATFDIYNGSNTQITLNPYSGIAIGKYPLYTGDEYTINTSNAKFWVDTSGNIHLKGNIEMTGGNINWSNIDESGSAAYILANGAYEYADTVSTAAQEALSALKTGLGYTYIDGKYVISPNIVGGSISAKTTLNVGNGNFVVDSAGNVTMRGVIQALDFRDLSGNSMMNNAYQFTSQYLNLLGLNVGNGNFVVDSSGNVSVKGNITMGSGSSINWDYVNTDPVASNASSTASSAYSLAGTANSTANSANTAATNAANNITKLANGSYSGGTFIDGQNVISPNITGGNIYGGQYWNLNKGAYIKVGSDSGGSWADFALFRSGGTKLFNVYDNGSNFSLKGTTYEFMYVSESGLTAYPMNNWNFQGATVTGLTATFA